MVETALVMFLLLRDAWKIDLPCLSVKKSLSRYLAGNYMPCFFSLIFSAALSIAGTTVSDDCKVTVANLVSSRSLSSYSESEAEDS